ncbi:NAD(P)-dependent oxidoreductase [Nocardia sp. NPDC059236]|uniref:NAD(P)-dependent oxidoreductase n=1 Tax=Nocardia sp. NPDC059236 TaxID=3346783 RepID=UPI003695E010
MSRIAIFGAAGTAGVRIAGEALPRGHTVLSVVRNAASTQIMPGSELVEGDALDADFVAGICPSVDVIVIAVGSRDGNPAFEVAKNMVAVVSAAKVPRPRLIHMGGGGSLLTPDGTRIVDSPGFPVAFLGSARAQAAALDHYREHASACGVSWTFISPPPVYFEPGQRLGMYRTGLDGPVVDAAGRSSISYEDFATAILDEIEEPHFVDQRFTVGY